VQVIGDPLGREVTPLRATRTSVFLVLGVAVVAMAAFGKWNPRDYVIVEELLDHPIVAGEIVIVLFIAAQCSPTPAERDSLSRLALSVLVVVFVASPLLLGWAVNDNRTYSELPVAGTNLFVDVHGFNWRTGKEPVGYLYLREGTGLLQRRVLIGTSKHIYDDTPLFARLVESGHIRVEWQWPEIGPSGQHWDIWFAPDTLAAHHVESTNGCADDVTLECVEVPAQAPGKAH